MEYLKIPIDVKTRQNLLDIDRAINELQTRKILILQTISNVHSMTNPVVTGQYDCLIEKGVIEDGQGQETEGEVLNKEA